MSDRRIDEFPELLQLNDTDIALISSGNNTYAVKVSTLKKVFEGGGGDVTSVNGKTGAVVLAASDVGAVAGVKGNAESTYRNGNVNIAPWDIGAAKAEDVTKINYAFRTQLSYYLDLPYPIKAGTNAFMYEGSNSDIGWARYDIPDAESNTRDKWLMAHTDAFAYVKNTQMIIEALQSAIAAAEAKVIEAYPTNTVSGATVSFPDGADGLPVKALTVQLTPIQAGSGDPSPSNVRTIAGRTGARMTRPGKNLANIADNTYTVGGVVFTVSGGAVHITGNTTGSNPTNRIFGYARLSAGVTYTISGAKSSGITDRNVLRIDLRRDESSSGVVAWGDSYNGFTYTPETDENVWINVRLGSGQTFDVTVYPQIELGSTATEFEPYSSTTYDVDWTEDAGVVYGGTLDVTTGLLTVTHGMLTIDSSNVDSIKKGSTTSRDEYYIPVPDGSVFDGVKRYVTISECASAGMICSVAPFADPDHLSSNYMATAYLGADGTMLQLRLNIALSEGVDTVDKMKQFAVALYNAGTPIQYVYPLKEPVIYLLDPVEILTLLGANTIYADCGDVSITYRIDPTLLHDNLDAGDVGFKPYLGVYGDGTIGKAVRTLEDDLFITEQEVGKLSASIIGDKLLIFNADGSVSWEEAPS